MNNKKNSKIKAASLLVALGIVYGDIGTSPLYVMKAILGANGGLATRELILGGVSLVFWTLTLQTTIKYVILTLQADNKGEGGIFSLYTLVRKRAKWLLIPAIIGGAALLADGMITPPVTVTSAIEGLTLVLPIQTNSIILIVITIITLLFLMQRFGTLVIGKIFGPMMFIWFAMLAILGLSQIIQYPDIIRALNPYYGIHILATNPKSVYILGAVFLCTTGAEALYSDLGHCGKKNIHYTWIFVKICLVMNYLGQGAYLMLRSGTVITDNPFFLIMPSAFIIPGTIIATFAAIIASQALISGSFTLVAEAIKLNLFPKLQFRYPNNEKGQIYIPAVNYGLYFGCVALVLHFKKSENMEAAYGLSITLAMIMTTVLLYQYLKFNKKKTIMAMVVFGVYVVIEVSFLYANLFKFFHGGYITLLIGGIIIFIMYIWIYGSVIKQRFSEYVDLSDHHNHFKELKADKEVGVYSTHLVYFTQSKDPEKIEKKVAYSIFNKQPKRAKYYWFVNVKVTDEPYTMNYKVNTIVPNETFNIQFNLGFRVDQRINVFLRQIVQDLVCSGELNYTSKEYRISNNERCAVGDFRFVLLEEILSNESELTTWENFIISSRLLIKKVTVSPAKWFGIDTSNVDVEKVPIFIGNKETLKLTRIDA